MNQIERLKENDLGFYALPVEDKAIMEVISTENHKNIVYADAGAGWNMKGHKTLMPGGIYRIHRNYTPAPDKPVFEGYELCEVKPDDDGRLRFAYGSGTRPLSEAVDFGCCSFNYKEAPEILWHSPVAFTDGHGHLGSYTNKTLISNWVPATLGWIAFKEEQEC